MLEAFLEGYNSTIMAYGQTGSGKTFTMGSEADYMSMSINMNANSEASNDMDMDMDMHKHGLIPRFMRDIFHSLQQRKIQDQEYVDQNNMNTGTNSFMTQDKKKDISSSDANVNAEKSPSTSSSSSSSTSSKQSQNQSRSLLMDYQVSASFLEVYGEDIHDLLNDDSRKVLPLREKDGDTVVVGLQEKIISSAQDALQVLHDGTLNRTTAATLMNKKSSRSHAVFTIILKKSTREYKDHGSSTCSSTCSGANSGTCGDQGNVDKNNTDMIDITTVSRFTFVDLAGSERMKKTGAEGERAKEGIKINQGLLALGNVINALADEERLTKRENVYVPYRQSKLTRLLQDALGGNSQTLFLACVSPSDTNASETASALSYANRARNIKNAPTKNVDATMAELQRLYALNSIFEKELVRVKFGNAVGEAHKDLIQSDEVKEYIRQIHLKAAESDVIRGAPPLLSNLDGPSTRIHYSSSASTVTTATTLESSSSHDSLVTRSHVSQDSNIKKIHQSAFNTISTNADNSLLGVNPDEDMALLDKILELQNIDQEFDKEEKEGQKKLSEVEGELEAQERLLLQLKDNMKGYHHLKDRFEAMMVEVQSLEAEKVSLAKELESAQVDPSKGCSKAIKKRLNDVETKLARARSETRKNQQMYRKVEQEAQKARALQQKIETLKHGKVALMKKQREAASKHRESIDLKSREIQTLKKKERKVGHKMTKLEAEVQKHKTNLQKRKVFCDKLQDKLKKTESHLMKVLALRKRNDVGRTKRSRVVDRNEIACIDSSDPKSGFATQSEETNSLKFLLEKLIRDRVSIIVSKTTYESKVAEYGDLMRSMVAEMKLLKEAQEELNSSRNEHDANEIEMMIRDSKQSVEDLEFRLEVIESDLERIRSKLPNIDDSDTDEETSAFEADAMKMIGNLDGPVSKSLLWDVLEVATKSEAGKVNLEGKLQRKEAALSSFESEIQHLNQHILHLSNDIEMRRSIGTNSSQSNENYLNEIIELKAKLSSSENDNIALFKIIDSNKCHLEEKDILLSTASEKLTLMSTTMKNAGIESYETTLETLQKLQEIWKVVGLPSSERDIVEKKIESSLELTCADALHEARELRESHEAEILRLKKEIKQMYEALGMQEAFIHIEKLWANDTTLLHQIDTLKNAKAQIIPTFEDARARRSRIISDVEVALNALGMSKAALCNCLTKLMNDHHHSRHVENSSLSAISPPKRIKDRSRQRRQTQIKHVEELVRALETEQGCITDTNESIVSSIELVDEHDCLSDEFLDKCEDEMKKLRMEKAQMMVSNQSLREEAKQLAIDMHLRGRELLSLSIHSIKKRTMTLPPWWNPHIAEEVCRAILSKKLSIKVDEIYTLHLIAIHDSLCSLSKGRRLLNLALKEIVKSAHDALLQTVKGELDARDTFGSFDAALARLPALSKDSVSACIEEMTTLIQAVDAMAQSEFEALTVVWDALNASNSQKGEFWAVIEESTKSVHTQHVHHFDAVLKVCTADIEEWLLCSVKDAQKIHRTLSNSLLKLNKIHEEVERLSTKQATKSKIISLDSELCILSAKLCEFEDKACSKQRLTRKTNSSSLLKEEKFRKQMQNNYTSKLQSLSSLISAWESIEGTKFDTRMMSPEVSQLLKNPDGVKKRTAFMHLKTTQQKPKRRTPGTASPLRRNANLSRPKSRQGEIIDKKNKESQSKNRRSRQRGIIIESRSIRSDKSRSPPPRIRTNMSKDRSGTVSPLRRNANLSRPKSRQVEIIDKKIKEGSSPARNRPSQQRGTIINSRSTRSDKSRSPPPRIRTRSGTASPLRRNANLSRPKSRQGEIMDKKIKEGSSPARNRPSPQRSTITESRSTRSDKSRSPPPRIRTNMSKDRSRSPLLLKPSKNNPSPFEKSSYIATAQNASENPTRPKRYSSQIFASKKPVKANHTILSSRQMNKRSQTSTTPTKSAISSSDRSDSPVLPFGQVLAKTPKGKENFRI